MQTGKEDEALAYMPRFMTDHFSHLNVPESTVVRGYVKMIFSWLPTSRCLLLSSPIELETSAVDSLSSDLSFPVYSIGPSIPYMNLNRTETGKQEPYFKSLDSQPNSSIVYISLGSFLSASTEQVNEMLMGLNASGIHYLRVSLDKHNQLKDLDGERGMVVPWCDQLRVLSHPSVGGFLTHCGWNSTMEGIYTGVPMLTFPLFTDQYPNSKLIVDDWRIGLRLKDEETERIIRREEVERIVRRFMDLESEESKGMRTRVAELKEKCRRAVGDGGSSSASLDAFVQATLTIRKE